MSGRSRILQVPYFAQPTGVTCQSTCLKMVSSYLEESLMESKGPGATEIPKIWSEINQSAERPNKTHQNAHENMKWWLQRRFTRLKFKWNYLPDEGRALETIVRCIDDGFPVIVSVSHANVDGHIILVVGYENYQPNMSSPEFKLVVHDPYGRFDPSLASKLFGESRFDGGMSLATGGQEGVGRNVRLPVTGSGQRKGVARGEYDLLRVSR
jgi:hypothetical protein